MPTPISSRLDAVAKGRHLPRVTPLVLAATATATSFGIAVFSGWERGGTFAEQLAYSALAGVVVSSVQLLPALSQGRPLVARIMMAAVCAAGLVVTLTGQIEFFEFAQQHAGARRARLVPDAKPVPLRRNLSVRDLTVIARDEEHARKALAFLDGRRCHVNCAADHLSRATLDADLAELATEAAEAKRRELAEDRQSALADQAMQLRDAMREDPVTARLSALTGVAEDRMNLLLGLVYAGVLDGIGAMGWYLVLSTRLSDDATECVGVASTGKDGRNSIAQGGHADALETSFLSAANVDARLPQLIRDVAEGKVPATVTGIRNHLGCAQETAAKLRRELLAFGAVIVRSDGGRHAGN